MLLATTLVEDFDRFVKIFSTKGAEKRKQHGSKGSTVFRDPNEDDRVWVLFDWDERAGVDEFLDFLPTAKAGGFQRSPAGVPVSQPVAGGVSRAVLHQLRRHRRGCPRLRQDLPQECSSPR